ncbi:hypothetical protein QBC47DRAFT_385104 [Echria macrotheca]|uniref:Uncharacterized protein n=1 Tax=Echria macrotheca TaxID=438768 RepID=A0AAJ0B9S2_9PEZI|nr:hypothetical protein QBC47DRAFT_385104 [Echria macrotheca]
MQLTITPSTWRVLGLSIAASYTGLGLFEILRPHRASAEFFGLGTKTTATTTENEGETEAVAVMGPLLGVRDLSIAAAMFMFAWEGKWREVGTVIVAGTILCAADCFIVWRRMGARLGAGFVLGAASWTVIGGVLYYS